MLIELKLKKPNCTISHKVECSKSTSVEVFDTYSIIRLTSVKAYKDVMTFFKLMKIDVIADDTLKKIVIPKQEAKFTITKLCDPQ